MSTTINFPILCAKCGENPPDVYYTYHEKQRRFDLWSLLAIFGGILLTRRQSFTYPVPLCNACNAEVTARNNRGRAVTWLGGFILFVGFLVTVSETSFFSRIPILANAAARVDIQAKDVVAISLILLGFIIAMSGPSIGKPRFATTDGYRFHFTNEAFQAAFARLNPKNVM